jgi:hypothetical protein
MHTDQNAKKVPELLKQIDDLSEGKRYRPGASYTRELGRRSETGRRTGLHQCFANHRRDVLSFQAGECLLSRQNGVVLGGADFDGAVKPFVDRRSGLRNSESQLSGVFFEKSRNVSGSPNG